MDGRADGRSRTVGPLARAALVTAIAGLSLGCVSAPVVDVSVTRWNDVLKARGLDPAGVPMPMQLTPEMKAFARKVAGRGPDDERVKNIQLALLDRSAFAFEYEKYSTFTAAEAFEARRGNCISLTNLMVTLARAAGVPMRAGLYQGRRQSERSGDLVLTFSHMVAVKKNMNSYALYDFYSSRFSGGELRLLDDIEVASLSLSNQGVQALRNKDPEKARDLLRRAVLLAPTIPDNYSNLGLALWRLGDIPGAYAAIQQGLEIAPYRANLLNNLAALHVAAGRRAEARNALAAANLEEASAYLLVAKGDLELAAGEVSRALRSYRKARSRDPQLVEPLIGIVRSERARGRQKAARQALQAANRLAPGDSRVGALLESEVQ